MLVSTVSEPVSRLFIKQPSTRHRRWLAAAAPIDRQALPQLFAMSRDFPEPDWKHLRVVHAWALQRFCAQTLSETQDILGDSTRTPHERCRALYTLIRERDTELARLFNDLRRSTATLHLAGLVASGLVTADELAGFSEATRAHLPSHEAPSEDPEALG